MADDEPSNWDKTAGDGLFGKGADPWDNTDDDAGADGRVHGLEDVDLVPGDDDGSVSTYGDNGAGPATGAMKSLFSPTGGKTYFTGWSMKVKVEGKDVVRTGDMTHNHASKDTSGADDGSRGSTDTGSTTDGGSTDGGATGGGETGGGETGGGETGGGETGGGATSQSFEPAEPDLFDDIDPTASLPHMDAAPIDEFDIIDDGGGDLGADLLGE